MDNSIEALLDARTSFLYRGNAVFQLAVCILTLVFSVKAFQVLHHRSVFHNSTRQLLFMSILYADFHAIAYGYLQTWSLYRSIVYENDPTQIMFTGYECYPTTWTVGVAKMSMSFIQIALTIDRIVSIAGSAKQSSHQGFLLNVFAASAAISSTAFSYSEGPTNYNLSSCFMQKDIPLNRVLITLVMYLVLSLLCLIINIIIIFTLYKSGKKSFNLNVRFNLQEVKNSSLAVCIISLIQFVTMTIYVTTSYILIYYRHNIHVGYFHNIILLFYTIPYAAVCLPISVIFCVRWISGNRKIKIVEMTKTNRNDNTETRMLQLRNAWDSTAPPIKY